MQITNRIVLDNVVRISSRKDIEDYAWTILLRMQPDPYKKYDCIKIRFTGDLVNEVSKLCLLFGNAGLVTKEIKRIEKIEVGKGVVLNDCWEATLRKIGALDFEEGEFEEYSRKMWSEIFEKDEPGLN